MVVINIIYSNNKNRFFSFVGYISVSVLKMFFSTKVKKKQFMVLDIKVLIISDKFYHFVSLASGNISNCRTIFKYNTVAI